jgi:AraC-like DNA-binding protein
MTVLVFLSNYCSFGVDKSVNKSNQQPIAELNQILFASDIVTIGRFHAPVEHPRFVNSGQIVKPIMAFPRTCVVIEHAQGTYFQANEKLVTFYNKDQDYQRQAFDVRGDICDWFEFSSAVLAQVASSSNDKDQPFEFAFLPSQTDSFVRQRLLISYLNKQDNNQQPLNAEHVEEVALTILADNLYKESHSVKPKKQHRELAEQVQYELSSKLYENDSLQQLAADLGVSVFHLCRVFKRVNGQSIHQYKNELRLRKALGRVANGESLTHIAMDLGFSSHSHFSTAFNRYFNQTPKTLRQQFRLLL